MTLPLRVVVQWSRFFRGLIPSKYLYSKKNYGENDQMTFAKQRGTIPPKKKSKWSKRNPAKKPTSTRTKHQAAPGNLGIVQGLIAAVGTYWPQLSTIPIHRRCTFLRLKLLILRLHKNPSTFHPKTRNRYMDPPKKYDPCEAAFDWRQRFRFSLHDLVVQFPDSKACKSMSNPHVLHLFPNFLGKRVD